MLKVRYCLKETFFIRKHITTVLAIFFLINDATFKQAFVEEESEEEDRRNLFIYQNEDMGAKWFMDELKKEDNKSPYERFLMGWKRHGHVLLLMHAKKNGRISKAENWWEKRQRVGGMRRDPEGYGE